MTSILCVGGDSDLTDLLRYVLTHEGYEVRVTRRGDDALRMVRSDGFELIIIDSEADLLDRNGSEVISSLHTFSQVPVIVLVAGSHDAAITAHFTQGTDVYITKPFNVRTLINRVTAKVRQ